MKGVVNRSAYWIERAEYDLDTAKAMQLTGRYLMDKREALTLARQYASIVVREMNPDTIVLYGSHAQGIATEESDIDVAVIFDNFSGDWFSAYTLLARLRRGVSSHIEPVLLDSANDASGFADEVLKTGCYTGNERSQK